MNTTTEALAAPKPATSIHPLEKWRHDRRLSLAAVGKLIFASAGLVSRVERGLPVRQKFIDRLIEVGAGAFTSADFVAQQPRSMNNGKSRKTWRARSAKKQSAKAR